MKKPLSYPNLFSKILLNVLSLASLYAIGFAQGPPIIGDKPIMLAPNNVVVKTLTEIRNTEEGTFVKAPLMIHYLPASNVLVGIYVPFTNYNFKEGTKGQSLGDIELLAKYQFYRKDQTGKTFRVVAKTIQTLPTGKPFGIEGIHTDTYQSYLGIIAGYESIKYGISNELGFNWSPYDKNMNELRHKLGFGLPLLKPTYPVNQVNLYFEYQSSWLVNTDEFLLLYAQGLQYAKGQITVEASIQLPLIQRLINIDERKYSLFLGTRYVF